MSSGNQGGLEGGSAMAKKSMAGEQSEIER